MHGTKALRAGAYLIGNLFAALGGLFLLPHPVTGWANRRRSAARRWLGAEIDASPTTRRMLALNALTGVPAGLLALLVLGNLVEGLIGMTLWWAFPADNGPHLWVDVAIDGWADAVFLGGLQAVVLGAAAYYVLPPLARLQSRVLEPSQKERMTARVETLTQTRADVVDAHGAELRRIERDLHDGAQGRLVAMTMQLALARQAVRDEPDAAENLIENAHASAEAALSELRDVVRTIYPPILADRGLSGALSAVVARSGVPARLDMGELGAVPVAVETAAYFTVVESLTNAAKHSGASSATVTVEREADRLRIRVTDDGEGGADEDRGTGLAGIRRRAMALDGEMTVDSPAGGPSVITVELPCAS
ncbi:sensor histidine kinase [Yinghuangia seranimata]|uniref:sensor histidine kinase n=1 Tax=Yinghuangia seranimata TaxID=408067 RepID=UPI00248C6834|nr:histidine kinase [Yinghuangia seranimata]MDI2125467.1 histidine kinase [Yinghuangia seranimata]